MKLTTILLPLALVILNVAACLGQEVEMADKMRQDGKIYVVIAIILLVLAGVFAYLITLDKKVKKLKEELEEKNL